MRGPGRDLPRVASKKAHHQGPVCVKNLRQGVENLTPRSPDVLGDRRASPGRFTVPLDVHLVHDGCGNAHGSLHGMGRDSHYNDGERKGKARCSRCSR